MSIKGYRPDKIGGITEPSSSRWGPLRPEAKDKRTTALEAQRQRIQGDLAVLGEAAPERIRQRQEPRSTEDRAEVYDRIKVYRAGDPGATWLEIWLGTPNHYSNAQSLRGSMVDEARSRGEQFPSRYKSKPLFKEKEDG
ncbi:hypothetical protein LCGC14_0298020 [marine sediment metagenome]|uniref:Uncharacterized protein n=1 Tax=marine sediment metagenome TaxID=412755 RepID=A0A0F9WX28_9ZZZZ